MGNKNGVSRVVQTIVKDHRRSQAKFQLKRSKSIEMRTKFNYRAKVTKPLLNFLTGCATFFKLFFSSISNINEKNIKMSLPLILGIHCARKILAGKSRYSFGRAAQIICVFFGAKGLDQSWP